MISLPHRWVRLVYSSAQRLGGRHNVLVQMQFPSIRSTDAL